MAADPETMPVSLHFTEFLEVNKQAYQNDFVRSESAKKMPESHSMNI